MWKAEVTASSEKRFFGSSIGKASMLKDALLNALDKLPYAAEGLDWTEIDKYDVTFTREAGK